MSGPHEVPIQRRDLLTKTVPACAVACAGICGLKVVPRLSPVSSIQQQHRFDTPQDLSLSTREQVRQRYSWFFQLILDLRQDLGDEHTIRILNGLSERRGTLGGTRRAERFPDRSFETLKAVFRPPALQNTITHEMVEDTEKSFAVRVTECIHAQVFKAAGLDGEIGHAAFCQGDYYMPVAFNPNFRLERSKTLMQGDDHCNHRYIDMS